MRTGWRVFGALALLWVTACGGSKSEETASGRPGGGARPANRQPEPVPSTPRHIVLVTADSLRADFLGCYGGPVGATPALDRLAKQGARFTEAHTPSGQTWPALTSMLTGKQPATHGVRRNGIMPRYKDVAFPKLLRDAGYVTGAFLGQFYEAIADADKRGFDLVMSGPGIPGMKGVRDHGKWDDALLQAASNWLSTNIDRKTFTWVHLANPRQPYSLDEADAEALASYQGWLGEEVEVATLRQLAEAGEIALSPAKVDELLTLPLANRKRVTYADVVQRQGGKLTFDQVLDWIVLAEMELAPEDMDYVRERYAAEVRATDRRIGVLIERLRAMQLARHTLVVVTAAHGEELSDHGHYLFHAASPYRGVLRTPLIFRWLGKFPPSVRQEPVDLLGLGPTLLDLAEVEVALDAAPDFEATSFAGLIRGTPEYEPGTTFGEVSIASADDAPAPLDALYVAQDERWKLITNSAGLVGRFAPYGSLESGGFSVDLEELYDLQRDPRETVNLMRITSANLDDLDRSSVAATPIDRGEYLAAAYRARASLLSQLASRWEAQRGEAEAPTYETLGGALAETIHGLAEAAVAVGESASTLALLAEAEAWRGEAERATELRTRALEAAAPEQRAELEARLRDIGR